MPGVAAPSPCRVTCPLAVGLDTKFLTSLEAGAQTGGCVVEIPCLPLSADKQVV